MASCNGDIVERVFVLGGDTVVRLNGVTDAFDLVDLVVRLGKEVSSLEGDMDGFVLDLVDLVFLTGPVAGTAMVCVSPSLRPFSGT